MKTHNKTILLTLIAFSSIVNGCNKGTDSKSVRTTSKRVIYEDQSAKRTDQVQSAINHQQNTLENENQNWANIMYSRSIGRFNADCPQKNTANGGSAFIFTGNKILTSRHTHINTGCDLQNITPSFQIEFNTDRYNSSTFFLVDNTPPNLWLTAYRAHSLSLVETNSLFQNANYQRLRLDTSEINLTPTTNLFNDRDLLLLTVDPIQVGLDFLNNQKPEIKNIPPIVLYDRIPSPQNENQQISTSDNNNVLWGYFAEDDPSSVKQTQNQLVIDSTEGDWDIAFEPVASSINFVDSKIPNTQIISSGRLLNAENASDFNKHCNTGTPDSMGNIIPFASSNLCFTMSVDLIQGSSGGAIVYRQNEHQSNALLAGVITSGIALINNVDDNNWNNSNYEYDLPNILPDELLTRALTLDYSTKKQIFTGNDEDGEESTKKESTFPQPTSCVGNCTEDENSKMVFFSCARAFELTHSFEWDASMNEAHGLGFIGGPVNFVDAPNKITEVGSLGLVCSQSNGKDHMTTTNWPALRAIGLKKSFDHIHNQPSMFTGHNLMYMLQNTHLRVESSGNGAKYNYRPLPMKVCPPDSVLVGATFISEPGKPIAGVSRIRCEHSTKGRTDFFLDATKYGHSPEFSQYIGRPFVDTNSSEVETSVECPQGERIRGISLHVDNQGTLGQQTRTKGLLLHCR